MSEAYDDKRAVELFFDRDERAISVTQAKYGGYCYKIALNILGDAADAEEVVSDCMLGVWNSIPPNRPESMTAYIGRIARNIAINRYNANHTQKRIASEYALSLEELEGCLPSRSDGTDDGAELKQAINEFLAQQPPSQRIMFVCRYFYLDSITDISQRLHVSESKVKTTLLRMRARLKKFLEDK